jgi:uncharacterized protein (TIGR02145 family)
MLYNTYRKYNLIPRREHLIMNKQYKSSNAGREREVSMTSHIKSAPSKLTVFILALVLSATAITGGFFINTAQAATIADTDITINVIDAPVTPDENKPDTPVAPDENKPNVPNTSADNELTGVSNTDLIFQTGTNGTKHQISIWVIIAILTVFLGLSITTIILINKYFKQPKLTVTKTTADSNGNPITEEDPDTEIIDINKLLKKHKAKKLLLQITPIFAFALIAGGVTSSLVKTYADTAACDDTQATYLCVTNVPKKEITVYKDANGNVTNPEALSSVIPITIESSSDDTFGYQLKASLADALSSYLTLTFGNKALSTTIPVTIKDTACEASDCSNQVDTPDTNTYNFNLTIDSAIPKGTYTISLNFNITGNTLPLPANMQEFSQAYCTQMDNLATVTVPDNRNGQNYDIRKLPDGNCWMISNLKYAGGGDDTYSDVIPAGDGTSGTLSNNTANTATTAQRYTSALYYDPSGGTDYTASNFYGYLYNWCAATGADQATCTSSSIVPSDAVASICPANWRLPNGGNVGDPNNDFDILNAKMAGFASNQDGTYQSTAWGHYTNWLFSGQFKGVFSGLWNSGSFLFQGGYGYLWSVSHYPSSSVDAFYVYFRDGGVYPDVGSNRDLGFAVRCLLD